MAIANQVTYPFVTRKSTVTVISSIDTRFFGSDKPCIIDQATATNLSQNELRLDCYIMKNEEDASRQYFLSNKLIIQPNETIVLNFLTGHYLEVGDLLFASTDFSSYECTLFLSYRELHNQL